jgi:hypothetical protein
MRIAHVLLATTLLLVVVSSDLPDARAVFLPNPIPQSVLTDPQDNVQYDPTYPGNHDHDYIDLTEVTLTYDETDDQVTVTLRTKDLTDFEGRTAESTLDYNVRGDFALEDQVVGWFSFNFSVFRHDLFPPSTRGATALLCHGSGFFDCVETDDVAFAIDEETQGGMRWTVPRTALMWYGDAMRNFQSGTIESYSPQGMFNVPVRAQNPTATSADVFDLDSLRPVSGAAEDDPLTGTIVSDGPVSPQRSQARSSAVGVVAALGCVVLALVGGRLRR